MELCNEVQLQLSVCLKNTSMAQKPCAPTLSSVLDDCSPGLSGRASKGSAPLLTLKCLQEKRKNKHLQQGQAHDWTPCVGHHHKITVTFIVMRANAKGRSVRKDLGSMRKDLACTEAVGEEGCRLAASGGTGGGWRPLESCRCGLDVKCPS